MHRTKGSLETLSEAGSLYDGHIAHTKTLSAVGACTRMKQTCFEHARRVSAERHVCGERRVFRAMYEQ